MNSIILASGSPRRNELLKTILNEPFSVIVPNIDELTSGNAAELVLHNAYNKGISISCHYPNSLIISADTVVVLENKILGKPSTYNDAIQMLRELSGKTHQVITGVFIKNATTHIATIFTDCSNVTFKNITNEEIVSYLDLVNPLDKAGGYALQEHGDRIIQSVHGDPTTVVGLPIQKLKIIFSRLGLYSAE